MSKDMFNADSARARVRKYEIAQLEKNYRATLELIEYRSSHGEHEAIAETPLSKEDKKKLEDLGFSVTYDASFDLTKIRW